MSKDCTKIIKTTFISAGALIILALACYFITAREVFFSIIISEAISFIYFVVSLFLYYVLSRINSERKKKYMLPVYVCKLVFIGGLFYLVTRFDFIDFKAFIISFLILFIIFLNIEVVLIYKKILFTSN